MDTQLSTRQRVQGLFRVNLGKIGKIGKMGIIGKYTSTGNDPAAPQFEVMAAPWEDEGEAASPDPSAAVCEPCGGNAIWWSDPYGGRHCVGCEPPPARSLTESIEVCIKVLGGFAWEEQTERLWHLVWKEPEDEEEEW